MIHQIEITKTKKGACKCCTRHNEETYAIKFINDNHSEVLELCRTHVAILHLKLENLRMEE